MKKLNYLIVLSVIMISSLAFIKEEAPVSGKDFRSYFTQVLKHSKEYTLEVANAMPEQDYRYRPTPEVRTFGEQMAHIGMSASSILHRFIKGDQNKSMSMEKRKELEQSIGKNKAQVIELITNSFDDAIKTLEKMSDEDLQKTFIFEYAPDKPELTKEEGFLILRDHITHHRGQAIIYLREKGITPPTYRPF